MVNLKCAVIAAAALLMVPIGASAAEPSDLVFTQKQGGKYIYCNNHELIRNTDLADRTVQYPRYLMNNEGLTADKYAMFISFVNRTDTDTDGGLATERGFDIETDVMFKAVEDTEITITALGFEVPEHRSFILDGTQYTEEDEWGCFYCWASYLDMPIRQLNSGNRYDPIGFEEVTFTLKAGETKWLSEYIENYREVPFCRSVNIMADFEIKSGVCDVNVAAFRSIGTLGDRSNLSSNVKYGSYYRDKQYKGISDGLNEVEAELTYTIDDSYTSGINLPVTVYNQYMPEGNTIEKWYTHLNPRADEWSYDICAESDMLSFTYYDPLKLEYYGSNVPEDERSAYYIFDTRHTDTSVYDKSYGKQSDYIPNRELTDDDGTDIACNLGNYGVIYNYKIKVTNNGNKRRYLTYQLATSSNNLVYLKDSEGNVVNGYALSKGKRDDRVSDNMACMTIPAMTTSEYTVCVVLTPNYPGGMQNNLKLTDYPLLVETYETERGGIEKDRFFDGREYYKWENGKLCLSNDRVEWRKINLPQSVESAIKGNWSEYSLTYTGSGYLMRPTLYDGGVYSHADGLFRDVYLLDMNFNLVSSYTFGSYPEGFAAANGVYYIKSAGSVFRSSEFKWWDLVYTQLPCWNYGRYSALMDNGKINLSLDGKEFDEVIYCGFAPEYIDSYGDVYYYTDGRMLYLSKDGMYWRGVLFNNKVQSFEISGDKIIANGEEERSLPEFPECAAIKIDGKYISFENEPFSVDDTNYVPLREAAELLDCEVKWEYGTITISKDKTSLRTMADAEYAVINGETVKIPPVKMQGDTSYIAIRTLAETFGYSIEYDAENNICVLNAK